MPLGIRESADSRTIRISTIKWTIGNTRISVSIDAGIQVDARTACWQNTARSRAIDKREAASTSVMEILKSLLRHKKFRVDGGIVATEILTIKFPRHSSRQQHLNRVIGEAQHRLPVDPAHIEVGLELTMQPQLVSECLQGRRHVYRVYAIPVCHLIPTQSFSESPAL